MANIDLNTTKSIASKVAESIKLIHDVDVVISHLEAGSFDIGLGDQDDAGGCYYIDGNDVILASVTPQKAIGSLDSSVDEFRKSIE